MLAARSVLTAATATAAVTVAMASRHHQHPPLPVEAAVISSAAVWGHYRDLLQRQGKRSRTITNSRATLWAFWADLARRGKTWDRCGPADLEAFTTRTAQVGRRRGLPLAANSRHVMSSRIRTFYRTCAEQGWLHADRMAGAVIPKGGQPRARALESDDLRTALLAAEYDPRLYLLLWLAYGEGLRVAEAAGLRVEHVDLGRPGRPGVVWVADGKGGRQRTVPLYPEVRAALIRWIAHAGLAGAGPLFPSPVRAGEPVRPATVGRWISAHLHSLGIDESAHALRHATAVQLLEAAGESQLLTVSRILGHSSTLVTERIYLLGFKGAPAQVIEQLPNPMKE